MERTLSRKVILILIAIAVLALIIIYHKPIEAYMSNSTMFLLHYFHQHVIQGILFALVVALLEALPVAGSIIPGTITMTIVGILIGTGTLPMSITIIASTIGAYTGDCIGYLIGSKYKEGALKVWPLSRQKKLIAVAESFFEKHGGKGIFIGRFFGLIRSCVPLVAGVFGIRPKTFYVFALIASFCWSIAYTLPGMLLGKLAIDLPASAMIKLLTFGALWIVLAWFTVWLSIQCFYILSIFINKCSKKLWTHMHAFQTGKWLRFVFKNNKDADDYRPLHFFILITLFAAAFLSIFISIQHSNLILTLNHRLHYLTQSLHNSHFITACLLISNFGKWSVTLAMAGLISIPLVVRKDLRTLICLWTTLLSTVALIAIFKHVSHSPRPSGINFVKQDSSFPSGHTTMCIVFYGVLAFFTAKIKPTWRKKLYAAVTILTISIALSRLYLGDHWLTDVIGSVFLGVMMLCFNAIIYYRQNGRQPQIKLSHWLTIVSISILLPWSVYAALTLKTQQHNHALKHSYTVLTEAQWWSHEHTKTPTYRLDRLGYPRQPLNLQWQGQLKIITDNLKKLGFTAHTTQTSLSRDIKSMTAHTEEQQPLLPWQYKNLDPELLMTKIINHKKVIEIRLWKSFISINDNTQPVWIGAVNFHTKQPFFPIHSRYRNIIYTLDHTTTADWLIKKTANWQHKTITLKPKSIDKEVDDMQWDGHLLLIKPKN